MQVFSTSTYERAIRKLLGEEARKEMEDSIVAAPDAAPVIRGTGGIRKLRWAGSGRAYAKADREDLTPADTKALTRLVAAIKKELQGK